MNWLKRLKPVGKAAFVGVATLMLLRTISAVSPYSLVYNVTPSIPKGFYKATVVKPTELVRGDLACFPYSAPQWAKDRAYLPEGMELCKPLVGLPGDRIEREGDRIFLITPQSTKRQLLATVSPVDSKGRAMPLDALPEGTLSATQFVFISNRVPNSYDSRYYGVIPTHIVRTRITPLYTW